MAMALEDLRPLLDQFRGDGLMVSCYANLSTAAGIPAQWPGPFRGKLTTIKQMLADDVSAWHEVEQNLAIAGRAVEAADSRHARGLAVFSAFQRGFFKSYALEVPVEDQLVVHQAPYLVPLLESICRQREYLVVFTDTHRGRLFTETAGSVRFLQEIDEAVPRRQHSSGERWGKEQATIARHRDDAITHYQKELVKLVEKVWTEHPFHGIILLGEHEILKHLLNRLPPRLAAQVVYEGPEEWPENSQAIENKIQTIISDAMQAREGQLVEDLKHRLREGYGVAAGSRAVIEAIEKGQVLPHSHGYLVFGPDPHEGVARCTACRSLWVEVPATCPRCQAPCVEANLWEELLLLAFRHALMVYCVNADPELTRRGGIAAVLAKPERLPAAAPSVSA
jgi:hypothetical protein